MTTKRLLNRRNFYSSIAANNEDVVRQGFACLIKVAEELKAPNAWIVCHTKGNLDGLIQMVVGKGAVKALQKGTPVNLPPACRLIFYHEKSLPMSAGGSPVLACFPNAKLLEKLDAIFEVSALIVLPWQMSEITPWLAAHNAVDIMTGTQSVPQGISNPVVAKALKWLTSAINFNTGISHPLDKGKAIFAFKALRKGKESYDPAEVKAWLIRNGMNPSHASDIEAIAHRPSARRSAADIGFDPDHALEQWREKDGN